MRTDEFSWERRATGTTPESAVWGAERAAAGRAPMPRTVPPPARGEASMVRGKAERGMSSQTGAIG